MFDRCCQSDGAGFLRRVGEVDFLMQNSIILQRAGWAKALFSWIFAFRAMQNAPTFAEQHVLGRAKCLAEWACRRRSSRTHPNRVYVNGRTRAQPSTTRGRFQSAIFG